MADGLAAYCQLAASFGVDVLLEPICRYEIDSIHTTDQAIDLCESAGKPANLGLLLDLFHMNIEEASVCGAICRAGSLVRHVHFVDNTRAVPGMGCMALPDVVACLKAVGYEGFLGIEAIPDPIRKARPAAAWPSPARWACEAISLSKQAAFFFCWNVSVRHTLRNSFNHYSKDAIMFSLNGKTALITGSGRGIGLAIAEAMAHQGANIFLSDINSSVVERAAGELAGKYPNVAVRGLTVRRNRQGADRKRHAGHQGCGERPANPRQQCGHQPAGTRDGHGRRPVAEDARHEPDQRVPGIAGGVPHAQGKGRPR